MATEGPPGYPRKMPKSRGTPIYDRNQNIPPPRMQSKQLHLYPTGHNGWMRGDRDRRLRSRYGRKAYQLMMSRLSLSPRITPHTRRDHSVVSPRPRIELSPLRALAISAVKPPASLSDAPPLPPPAPVSPSEPDAAATDGGTPRG